MNIALFFHQASNIIEFTHRDTAGGKNEVARGVGLIEGRAQGSHGIGNGGKANGFMTGPLDKTCETERIGFVDFAVLQRLARGLEFVSGGNDADAKTTVHGNGGVAHRRT